MVRTRTEFSFVVSAGRLRAALDPVRGEGDAALLEFVMCPPDLFMVRVLARDGREVRPVETLDTPAGL